MKEALVLDDWQKEVLETRGNICLRSGRQVGKSTVISVKAGEFAIRYPKKTILVIASVERQAYLLFEKTLNYLMDHYKDQIRTGKDKPTRHKIQLKNGSVIHCLPTGLSGYGIRGYTIDLLIADEAAFIPEEVWQAVTPMLAATKGNIILLSTPFGKDRYFYRCFTDPNFTKFHISSEDCPRIDKLFLEQEKKRMTRLQYSQEYQGEFIDELMQLFNSDLVRDCMDYEPIGARKENYKYFLGIDIARYGKDQTTYIIIEKRKEELFMKDMFISEKMAVTHVIGKIKDLHRSWNFTKIYIDDGGLGAAVLDILLEDQDIKRVIEGINNAKKSIEFDPDKPRSRKLLKEDLYSNLLALMQSRKIHLMKDPELFRSLTSIQYEYSSDGNIKIFGNYTHIAEGLIRACWCIKDKSLNIYIY